MPIFAQKLETMAKNGISKSSEYIRFDWAIKRILRDKANFEVLEGLVSVLLKQKITITGIAESEANKDRRKDKGNRVDVKAITAGGEQIIVECQLTRESDYFQRMLFGTSVAVTEQIDIGENYGKIHKVYSINILYFDFGSGDDYAYHGKTIFRGMTNEDAVLEFNDERERKYLDGKAKPVTSPDDVYPEYFILIVNRFNEVAKTPIEEWMAYLKDGVIADDTTEPGLQEARRKMNYMSMTEEERREYRDYMISVHVAEDNYETAITEGMIKGVKVGIEQGEKKRETEIARDMKSDGLPTETISKYTGLSAEEIAAL